MLKKIPSEQPDMPASSSSKTRSATKNGRKKHRRAPNASLQKKYAVVSTAECRLIRMVGVKMLKYGKKSFKTNDEYQRLIRDVQVSVLCLQKQQRQFLKDSSNRKKK